MKIIFLFTTLLFNIICNFQARAKNCSKFVPVFFYDISNLARSELSVFNSKFISKTQNFSKHPFLHFIKKYQIEIRNAVYVYSDIFTMVIDINRQIMENFSKSQVAGSWERNLAFVINLSGTQKLPKHQLRGSIKLITD